MQNFTIRVIRGIRGFFFGSAQFVDEPPEAVIVCADG
jgi:hypothetical protein